MNNRKMRAEAAIPGSATADEIVCRGCGSSSGAAAAYCSTCGIPLLHDVPVSHVGTRTLSGERLLAAYVIPGILITLFCWIPGLIGWIPGLIGLALAIDAYGKLRSGDVEGADSDAWKARIALSIGGVILGVSWLAPLAGRVLDFLTSL